LGLLRNMVEKFLEVLATGDDGHHGPVPSTLHKIRSIGRATDMRSPGISFRHEMPARQQERGRSEIVWVSLKNGGISEDEFG